MPSVGTQGRVFVDDETEWRFQQLLKAGFNVAQSEALAKSHVDLHYACELVRERGAPADIAFDILS